MQPANMLSFLGKLPLALAPLGGVPWGVTATILVLIYFVRPIAIAWIDREKAIQVASLRYTPTRGIKTFAPPNNARRRGNGKEKKE